jgi:hypothetical protein
MCNFQHFYFFSECIQLWTDDYNNDQGQGSHTGV